MKRKQYTSHIELLESTEHKLHVSIDDYELFDMIGDIFTEEHNIDFLHQEMENKYVMHIESTITFEKVDKILSTIDKEEIERIYSMNN